MPPVKDYYAILEIEPQSSSKEIKAAYRALARRWHPDTNLNNIAVAEAHFKELAEAYETLGDTERRARYDVFRPRSKRPAPSTASRPTPTWKPTEPTSKPDVQPAASTTAPVIIKPTTRDHTADPDLERAYTTFAAAFDSDDEKSAGFTGFFGTFMNAKP